MELRNNFQFSIAFRRLEATETGIPLVFSRICNRSTLQRSQTAICVRNSARSLAQFGQYRPEVKCRTKLHFRVRLRVPGSDDRGKSVSVHHRCNRKENYSGSSMMNPSCTCLRVIHDVCISYIVARRREIERANAVHLPLRVFPLRRKVHGRLSAIMNANRLRRNSEKLKRH